MENNQQSVSRVDVLGAKFKQAEAELRQKLPQRAIVGLRLDGRSFHQFTRQFAYPYDFDFMNTMDAVATRVLEKTQGAMFAYVQSDEISIFFTNLLGAENAELDFGGKVEKIVSTSASLATGSFLRTLPNVEGIPVFDSRLFVLNNWDDLREYVDWRRLDARKNSISMAASSLYSHRELQGKSTRERHALLEGTEYEVLPGGFFEGRLVVRGETSGWKTITATREEAAETINAFESRALDVAWNRVIAESEAVAEAKSSRP